MMATSPLEAMPAKGSIMPADSNLNEEYEANQLLDTEDKLEDGEIESSVDKGILDEPAPFLCTICKADLTGTASYEKFIRKSYECMKDEQHNYCNPCAYKSMLTSKYCPSGNKCKYPAKAAPWNWHRDVIIECSLTYVMEKYGVIETFQCPACAIHCPSKEALDRH